jgi:hypothetical protein
VARGPCQGWDGLQESGLDLWSVTKSLPWLAATWAS